jgi:uncharacterized protein YifN (PemK superfamily)
MKKKQTVDEVLDKIKTAVEAITNHKRRGIVLNWLLQFCQYLKFEESFDPAKYKNYVPGEIIDIDFGFNVAHEFGGRHFGVVIENNQRRNPNIMVVPLSSYDSIDEVRRNEVNLGIIEALNEIRNCNKGTKVMINQLRVVSKLRIYYPKYPSQVMLHRLSKKQLETIYGMIHEYYCSKF